MGSPDVTLCFAGDVMTARGIDQVLPHPGSPELHQRNGWHAGEYVRLAEARNGRIAAPLDYSAIWGEALAEWERRNPDYRIVNLETAVTTCDDYWPDKAIHYRMHPANAPCLQAAGFDCCVLANNHVLDWGSGGLIETLQTVRQLGIETVGAGADGADAAAPAILQKTGVNRAIVFAWAHPSSYTPGAWAGGEGRPGVNLLPEYTSEAVADIARQIGAVRREGDVVVASIHWGLNWGYDVGLRQRWFAHRLIDEAGVHIVFGHSSHHPLAVEVYRNQPILYGCGDCLNDYEGIAGHARHRPDLSALYFVRLEASRLELAELTLVPMQIRGFQLRRASDGDVRWLSETLNRGGVPVPIKGKLRRWARLRRTRFNCRWQVQPDNSLRLVRR